jgi:hypothetical protein
MKNLYSIITALVACLAAAPAFAQHPDDRARTDAIAREAARQFTEARLAADQTRPTAPRLPARSSATSTSPSSG